MCHFCHVLRKNSQAPTHNGSNCLDKANTFSRVPLNKRTYENGTLIQKSNPTTNSCSICFDKSRDTVFIPCGHVATCESCASLVQLCPICRQAITNKQKLFFA